MDFWSLIGTNTLFLIDHKIRLNFNFFNKKKYHIRSDPQSDYNNFYIFFLNDVCKHRIAREK